MGRTRDLDTALAAMPAQFVACRDYRHAWQPHDAYRIRGGYDTRVQCGRCETVRHRILNARGEVISSRLIYPDGYLLSGLGRLTGTDQGRVRLAGLAPILRDGPAE
jgi:hypothetical protein